MFLWFVECRSVNEVICHGIPGLFFALLHFPFTSLTSDVVWCRRPSPAKRRYCEHRYQYFQRRLSRRSE